MAFRLEETEIEGILLARSEPAEDERGSFARTFDAAVLRELGLPAAVEQASVSRNRVAGTLRGMHWQQPPHAETKLIRCSRGAVFDVLADIRPASPTYGKWLGWELREGEPLMLLAGAGIAHGFQTLTDDAELTYLISTAYEPAAARGARWDDPLLGIEWPEPPAERVISERDRSFPDLADAADPGAPA
jgi:dTDP-4-dehydrorhamnose 3,5-epimerase